MKIIKDDNNFFLAKTIKSSYLLPKNFIKLDFVDIKNKILGNEYYVSLVIIGEKKSKKLNYSYRKIDKPTDVLSFALDKKNGEVFITPKISIKKSKKFNMNHEKYLLFLVIHAFLHLKGFKHGAKMEKAEADFLSYFSKKSY